jgi:TPR repeat protein
MDLASVPATGGCRAPKAACSGDMSGNVTFGQRMAEAEQGNAAAQYGLGVCFEFGRGVSKDRAEAVRWYLKAAEQGHPQAQFRVGFCYAGGLGVPKSDTEAVGWYRKAAAQNCADALLLLALCYEYQPEHESLG